MKHALGNSLPSTRGKPYKQLLLRRQKKKAKGYMNEGIISAGMLLGKKSDTVHKYGLVRVPSASCTVKRSHAMLVLKPWKSQQVNRTGQTKLN